MGRVAEGRVRGWLWVRASSVLSSPLVVIYGRTGRPAPFLSRNFDECVSADGWLALSDGDESWLFLLYGRFFP